MLLLLDCLFAHIASEPVDSIKTPGNSSDSDVGSTTIPSPVQETDIHMQDYNRSVLKLVMFPNVLLVLRLQEPLMVRLAQR